MKKSILLFIFAFALHGYVASKNSPLDNGVALWGNLGYNVLTNFKSDVHPIGCAGAHLGIGWDARALKSNFLVQVGAEFGYSGSFMRHDEWDHSVPMLDTEADFVEMNYHLHNVREYVSSGDAALQVLVGYEGQNGAYFLLGPAIRYCFAFRAQTTCEVQSTGRYKGLIGDDGKGLFGSEVPMNDHFFTNNSYSLKTRYDNKPVCQFHLEVGYASRSGNQRDKRKTLYRVAAFADAGYVPIGRTSTDMDDVVFQSVDGEYRPQANAFLWRGANSGLGQLSVGVKFTLIFRHRNEKCMLCKH